jgi:hypothetical protein
MVLVTLLVWPFWIPPSSRAASAADRPDRRRWVRCPRHRSDSCGQTLFQRPKAPEDGFGEIAIDLREARFFRNFTRLYFIE